MKKYKFLLVLAFMAGLLFSCESNNSRSSGEQIEEERSLEPFSRLKVSGIINLYLSQGDSESLRVEGDKQWVEQLKVEQRGNLLSIRLKEGQKSWGKNEKIEVYLQLKDLSELEFEGAGQIKTSSLLDLDELLITGKGVGNIVLELDAELLEAKLNFVGNMELKGFSRELLIENEGVGNIDASQLICQKVELASSGIGMIAVHAEEELIMNVSGIGSVSYTGNPKQVTENVSGLGKVNRN
ncbi:head GIN domain-containing protein [Cecembia rubra]|uniref:Putative autotransporter adhesin-like protein n=1 Tax=Cecembia rubra TaxID=1485585 RepID=A0A2P8DPW5_9BACT|nr:head GIN domain-containing protein [Cecembia rubra]PSK99275.1 putative autotransporter adhesin-like protein [Cecembia rubra]